MSWPKIVPMFQCGGGDRWRCHFEASRPAILLVPTVRPRRPWVRLPCMRVLLSMTSAGVAVVCISSSALSSGPSCGCSSPSPLPASTESGCCFPAPARLQPAPWPRPRRRGLQGMRCQLCPPRRLALHHCLWHLHIFALLSLAAFGHTSTILSSAVPQLDK